MIDRPQSHRGNIFPYFQPVILNIFEDILLKSLVNEVICFYWVDDEHYYLPVFELEEEGEDVEQSFASYLTRQNEFYEDVKNIFEALRMTWGRLLLEVVLITCFQQVKKEFYLSLARWFVFADEVYQPSMIQMELWFQQVKNYFNWFFQMVFVSSLLVGRI